MLFHPLVPASCICRRKSAASSFCARDLRLQINCFKSFQPNRTVLGYMTFEAFLDIAESSFEVVGSYGNFSKRNTVKPFIERNSCVQNLNQFSNLCCCCFVFFAIKCNTLKTKEKFLKRNLCKIAALTKQRENGRKCEKKAAEEKRNMSDPETFLRIL